MERITSTDAVGVLPAADESGSPGYFTNGDPGVPTPATTVTAEWCNRVQEELCAVIEGEGLTLDPDDSTQLDQAIDAKIDAAIDAASGHIIQSIIVESTTTDVTSGSGGEILFDGSIPQNTEGVQVFSQAITPKRSDSTIIVEALLHVGNSGNYTTVALFKDSGADAISAGVGSVANNGGMVPVSVAYKETSGSTTARTFKVRYGAAVAAGEASLNRSHNGNTFGSAKIKSYLRITEIAP